MLRPRNRVEIEKKIIGRQTRDSFADYSLHSSSSPSGRWDPREALGRGIILTNKKPKRTPRKKDTRKGRNTTLLVRRSTAVRASSWRVTTRRTCPRGLQKKEKKDRRKCWSGENPTVPYSGLPLSAPPRPTPFTACHPLLQGTRCTINDKVGDKSRFTVFRFITLINTVFHTLLLPAEMRFYSLLPHAFHRVQSSFVGSLDGGVGGAYRGPDAPLERWSGSRSNFSALTVEWRSAFSLVLHTYSTHANISRAVAWFIRIASRDAVTLWKRKGRATSKHCVTIQCVALIFYWNYISVNHQIDFIKLQFESSFNLLMIVHKALIQIWLWKMNFLIE